MYFLLIGLCWLKVKTGKGALTLFILKAKLFLMMFEFRIQFDKYKLTEEYVDNWKGIALTRLQIIFIFC